jgi:hypothetical protein
MIRRFNRRQRIRAVGSFLIGVVAYFLAFGFFHFIAGRAASMLPPGIPDRIEITVSASVLTLITLSGWIRHRRNVPAELSDAVMWKGEVETPGAGIAQLRINQVSSTAWMLSQLFLAGPLRILQAVDMWRSCLPVGTGLEQRMELLLRELKSRDRWVPVESFKDHWEPMAALIRTGHVDFSSIKGRVKASS